MAELDDARQQVQSARQDLEAQRKQTEDAQRATEIRRKQLTSIQALYSRRGVGDIVQSQAQTRNLAAVQQDLQQRQKELTSYESEVLKPAETEIRDIERKREAYAKALDVYRSNDPRAIFTLRDDPEARNYFRLLQKSKREAVEKTLGDLKAQGVTEGKTLAKIETELKKNLGKIDSQRLSKRIGTIIDVESGEFDMSTEKGFAKAAKVNVLAVKPRLPEIPSLVTGSTIVETSNVLDASSNRPTSFVPKVSYDLARKIGTLKTKQLRGDLSFREGAELFGASLAKPTVDTVKLISSDLPAYIKDKNRKNPSLSSIKRIPSVIKSSAELFGSELRESPQAATGTVLSTLISGKGVGSVVKGTGKVATRLLPPPKYTTSFLGTSEDIADDIITTSTKAITTRETLFNTRKFLSKSVSVGKSTNLLDDSIVLNQRTKGAIQEIIDIPERLSSSNINPLFPKRSSMLGKVESFKEYSQSIARQVPEITLLTTKKITPNTIIKRTSVLPVKGTSITSTSAGSIINKKFTSAATGFLIKDPARSNLYASFSAGQDLIRKAKKIIPVRGTAFSSKGVIRIKDSKIVDKVFDLASSTVKNPMTQDTLSQIQLSRANSKLARALQMKQLKDSIERNIERVITSARQQKIESVSKNIGKSYSVSKILSGSRSNELTSSPPRSSFYGTGQYERTDSTLTSDPMLSSSSVGKTLVTPSSKLQIKLGSVESNLLRSSQSEQNKLKQISLLKQFTTTTPRVNQRIVQINKQRSRQDSAQLIDQIQRSRSNTRSRSRTGLGSLSSSKQALKNKDILAGLGEQQGFEVITYLRGKEVSLGKDLPRGRAELLGSKEVLRGLRASFKLRPSGTTRKSDISFRAPSRLFRPGKRDPTRFVQRAGGKEGGLGRLASLGERREIQAARRNRRGGFNFI